MELKDFYLEENDVFGMPQIYRDIPIYPIKLLDNETSTLMNFLLAHDKLEFVNKAKMPFDGVKQIYKKPYMKAMLYGLSYDGISKYYEALEAYRRLLLSVMHIDNTKEDGDDIVVICDTGIKDPMKIFDSALCIIVKKNGSLIKLDDEDLEVIRECILKQSGISLKSLEGYNADMEEIKRNKYASEKTMSFSDEIFAFVSMSGLDVNGESLKNYTLYQFKYHFGYLQQYINYRTLYPLQAAGQVKFGSPIKYYLEPIDFDKGRYDDLLIKADDFAQSGVAKSVNAFSLPDVK